MSTVPSPIHDRVNQGLMNNQSLSQTVAYCDATAKYEEVQAVAGRRGPVLPGSLRSEGHLRLFTRVRFSCDTAIDQGIDKMTFSCYSHRIVVRVNPMRFNDRDNPT